MGTSPVDPSSLPSFQRTSQMSAFSLRGTENARDIKHCHVTSGLIQKEMYDGSCKKTSTENPFVPSL